HPVFPDQVKQEHWWAWRGTTALLVGEYMKYLAAVFRRVIEWLQPRGGGTMHAAMRRGAGRGGSFFIFSFSHWPRSSALSACPYCWHRVPWRCALAGFGRRASSACSKASWVCTTRFAGSTASHAVAVSLR